MHGCVVDLGHAASSRNDQVVGLVVMTVPAAHPAPGVLVIGAEAHGSEWGTTGQMSDAVARCVMSS